MSLQPKPQLFFADWLATERACDQDRTQYVNGEVFAMAGGSEAHNLICGNVLRELGNRFKGRPCYPLVALDTELPLAEVYDKVEFASGAVAPV